MCVAERDAVHGGVVEETAEGGTDEGVPAVETGGDMHEELQLETVGESWCAEASTPKGGVEEGLGVGGRHAEGDGRAGIGNRV